MNMLKKLVFDNVINDVFRNRNLRSVRSVVNNTKTMNQAKSFFMGK